MFKWFVNSIVYSGLMGQVQPRLPEKLIAKIDFWVAEGRFRSRSDAIESILLIYEEREKTREFFKLLHKQSEQAKKSPETLASLWEV